MSVSFGGKKKKSFLGYRGWKLPYEKDFVLGQFAQLWNCTFWFRLAPLSGVLPCWGWNFQLLLLSSTLKLFIQAKETKQTNKKAGINKNHQPTRLINNQIWDVCWKFRMLTLLYLQENNNKCLQSENQHVYSDIMDFFLKKKKGQSII